MITGGAIEKLRHNTGQRHARNRGMVHATYAPCNTKVAPFSDGLCNFNYKRG